MLTDKEFFPPLEAPRLRVLSLGVGVQSTTLALMAAHGEIGPMPDCAIFADTGAEPTAVYEYLRFLVGGNVLPFPVHVVAAGNIIEGIEAMMRGERWGSVPFFTMTKDGTAGPVRRQCTKEYKIQPIIAKMRELLGYQKGQRIKADGPIVEQWIGISTDEIVRIKDAREPWIYNRFPLIDKRMSRSDCLDWLRRNGYPEPPKSSCIFCPYHSNAEWRRLRDTDPEGWAEAVRIDEMIRDGAPTTETRTGTGGLYLHRSMKPLAEVDFSTDEERGQLSMLDECDGMCGV